jgi:tetratricopeptide (TPR) repeat protein/transcriptional regulator with XRE-family HTH domain
LDRGDDDFLSAGIGSLPDLAAALRQLRRRHARRRDDTQLTYRELAARTGYAHGAINAYFRGETLPPTDRLDVLVALLGGTDAEKSAFATSRDRVEEDRTGQARAWPGSGTAAATRTLPRDIGSFTGREAELRYLEDRAYPGGDVGVHVIGGMAGVGKTALAVHAAHRLAPRFPDGQIFLTLHGHTPGQQPVGPADALASLLLTAGVSAASIPPGLAPRAGLWRDYLAGRNLLLVLDDAAGHEQVSPLLPGTGGSQVLVTSRRHLTALEGAHATSLDTLAPGEAAALLIRLAARPGLDLGDPAVGSITRLCGYLPLAVAMLARQLHHHRAWTAAELAADLAASYDSRLEFMHAENVSVAAAFDLSYRDLQPGQQQLFRRLGVYPGTEIDAYAAAALDGTDLATARRRLEALYDQYLLTEPAHGRYRMHDLIRAHARTLSSADPPAERDAATGRILDYYLHTVSLASRHVARRQPAISVTPPASVPSLPDRAAARAWLDAERMNLHTAADHAVAVGRPGHAVAISAVMHGYLCGQGHWDQALALHRTALAAVRQAGDRAAEPRALTGLGIIQRLTGDGPSALSSLTCALGICRGLGDRPGEAAALNELGVTQHVLGDPSAVPTLSQALEVFRELGDRSSEATALNDLALAKLEAGSVGPAGADFARALDLHRDLGDTLWEANALNNLGAVHRLLGDYEACAASHSQALGLYRNLGSQAGEAKVLNSIGEMELARAAPGAAATCHEQALAIAVAAAVAVEEGHAREGIGRCHLHAGRVAEATDWLQQSLAIYQRIRSPDAHRVSAVLASLGLPASLPR